MIEHIHFYYCNDLHSHFDQWPNIVHYFNKKKKQHAQADEQSWRIDIGDHVDRFHPIAEAYNGKANVELLNEAGIDFATIGNNEGITLEHEHLYHLYDQANFQVTCGNLKPLNKNKPSWLQHSITIQTKENLNIKLFGLTAPFNAFYHPLGWHVESPYDYIEREINELKRDADILILLSHLGLSEDQLIAERYPEIDIIIGGHTHHLLKNGKEIQNTLLTAAGKHGKFVGEVHIEWDHQLDKIVNKQAYTVETEHLSQDQDTVNKLEKMNNQAQELLNKQVTYLENSLTVNWFEQTPIIDSLTDKLKDWTNADISMLNAGILLENIGAGEVTYGDIHRICPHPINPCTVKLRGIEVLEIVRGAHDEALMRFELKGFGFRGKVMGKFIFSGIDIDTDIDEAGIEHVHHVTFNGHEIEHDKVYTFATADMFTFGQMFPEIARSTTKEFYLPEFMRDLLADALRS
ncbi:2',3'-cyclic-nucleotide 2'-phosphodiesterase/5'-or 3'-nucleotidase, 5'-nucleotidase family [Gracilibacillus orientalis]|uniref:2',3'-cyclic-nucleotide 2'-phosphodiesterase/5'-or 3'-nucleotidase, 5'-nucleotidase family n=1 Tax=Gracilibacillus orientalis TaxID=334253 RepID=A0A1I4QFM2_9BACI|nr:bifunctional UDP-sugar hydrolase/5'-nucleotidase [Gracilibacillus orientalis]SFM38824.1 2',3'-cyclic-nucleotide 2'-phosphodiesterase/5'-or 3'-nucleotidase, 5'-nucleotidase family [Gracilibacillus orientalis]